MYHKYNVNLSDGQKQKFAAAYKNKSPLSLRLTHDQLRGSDELLLTERQINKIKKAQGGVDLDISKTQMRKQTGGFLGALLKTVVPFVSKLAPKVLGPLASGTLSGLASTGIGKLLGNGMVPLDPGKKSEFVKQAGPYLTKCQKEQLKKGNSIRLTAKQKQNGGFLPFLLGALAPAVISGLLGKGLQVDSAPRTYRRIPKKK